MSQHFFKTEYEGRPVEVVMGWDRPLQEYFLWIERLDEDEEGEQVFLWSDIDTKVADRDQLSTFLEVLAHFKISVPAKMIQAIEQDGLENVGNKEVVYPPNIKKEESLQQPLNDGTRRRVC